MRLEPILAASVERHASREALRGRDRALGYGEMWLESERVAERLREHGAARGAFVLLCGNNRVDWLTTFLAAVRAEALVGVLDPALAVQHRERIAAELGAAAVFTDEGISFAAHAPPAAARSRTDAMTAAGARILMFTSGSTGEPKGVLVSEANVVANIAWNADAFGLTEGSVACNFMPLSAFLNLSYVIACLAVGATVLVERNLAELQGTLARMDAAGLTHLNTVPLALRTILDRGDLEGHPLASLRGVRVGAGVLPFDLAVRTLDRFPRVRLVSTYGMTEIGLVATRSWERDASRPEDVGTYRAVAEGTEVALVDDPDGGGSEIALASPVLHRGYYHVGEGRLELSSGPYATGDLGERTANGALRIVGRKKQIAKVAGVLVNLEDLARIGRTCPAVAESVAIGIEHPVLGEEVHLFVAEKTGAVADPSAISRALMAATAMKRVPRIHVVEALPRTAMGKIARGELERIARGSA